MKSIGIPDFIFKRNLSAFSLLNTSNAGVQGIFGLSDHVKCYCCF